MKKRRFDSSESSPKTSAAPVKYAGQEPVPAETGIIKLDGRWFGSSHLSFAGVNLRLVYFGINKQIGHHSFPYHQHDFAELVLTLRGEGQLLIGEPGQEQTIACRAGDLYVMPSTTRHGARWDCAPGKGWEIIIFQFELALERQEDFYLQDQSLAMQFAPFYEFFIVRKALSYSIPREMRGRAMRSAMDLRKSLDKEPELAPVLILNYWLWLIAHISWALKQSGKASGDNTVIPLRERDQRMQRARELLADPSWWSRPLPEIARAVGMSFYHFIREFGARYGQTPMQYRTQCVMQSAGRLLTHTDEPIYRIADACGYESQSAFAKAFHRQTGVSPMEYRRRFSRPAQSPSPIVARSV